MKKRIFLIIQLILAPFIVHFSFIVTQAQDSRWEIQKSPTNCEINGAFLLNILLLMKEEPNEKGKIIIIARLGKGEKNSVLNKRRLFNVREQFKYVHKIPSNKIIIAEGERTSGFGRVELYWNGELIGGLVVETNKDICMGEPKEGFYPFLK